MSLNGNNGHQMPNDYSDWATNPRWSAITRPYSYADVLRLRGSIQIEYTLARLGAERLFNLMHADGDAISVFVEQSKLVAECSPVSNRHITR